MILERVRHFHICIESLNDFQMRILEFRGALDRSLIKLDDPGFQCWNGMVGSCAVRQTKKKTLKIIESNDQPDFIMRIENK